MKASASPLKSASHHNTAVRPERASHLRLVRTRGGMGRARARFRDSTHQLDVVGSKKHLQQPNSIHQARLNHSPGSHPRDALPQELLPTRTGSPPAPRSAAARGSRGLPLGCGAALSGASTTLRGATRGMAATRATAHPHRVPASAQVGCSPPGQPRPSPLAAAQRYEASGRTPSCPSA